MKSYTILRHRLADIYRSEKDQELLGRDSGLKMALVDLKGTPLNAWTALLEAALRQRKLSRLFENIAAENADNGELLSLIPEAERELQSAGETSTNLIDFTSIQIGEPEELELSYSLVRALDRLSKPLVDFALSTSPPKPEEADDALKGERTIEAKAKLDRYRKEYVKREAELINQRKRLTSDAAEKRRQIETIRSLSPPSQPIRPSRPILFGRDEDEHHRLLENHARQMTRYQEDMVEYEVGLARYKETQAQLPALGSELRERVREVERATNEIQAFQMAQIPILEDLKDRILAARDLDMRECVVDLLEESTRILLHESALLPAGRASSELEGFARFLLAAVLDDKFQRVQGASGQELANVFTSRRERIETILESKYEDIARPWLAAVGSTLGILTRNKKLFDQIDVRLNRISEDELNRKLEQLNELERASLPVVPEYQNLVSPADIDRAEHECLKRMQSLSAHLSDLEEELGEGGRELAERVAAAQADAVQVLAELHKNAQGCRKVAQGMEIVLNLASRAVPLMGPWAIGFCDSLRIEAERRAGVPTEELLRRSVTRLFWWADAQELVKGHRSTDYINVRAVLQRKLREGKARVQEFTNAREEIRKQPERMRDKYLSRFRRFVPWAAIPLANLIVSHVQEKDVIWLREALESTVPAYVELATVGRQLIRKRLLISALSLALLVFLTLGGVLYVLWWKDLVPVNVRQFLSATAEDTLPGIDPLLFFAIAFSIVILVYGVNAYITARSLSRWNSFARSGGGRVDLPIGGQSHGMVLGGDSQPARDPSQPVSADG